jgi:hypothetical protein
MIGTVFEHDQTNVRTLDEAYIRRLPGAPFDRLLDLWHAKGGFTVEDMALESLRTLFDVSSVNLYDVTEPGNPRIRFVCRDLPFNGGVGFRGRPIRECPAPADYLERVVQDVEACAASGVPAFHHITVGGFGYPAHRMLAPVRAGETVDRVAAFILYPSAYMGG